jgi:hypothetical protein
VLPRSVLENPCWYEIRTDLGERLLMQFQDLLKMVEAESDKVYNDLMAALIDS